MPKPPPHPPIGQLQKQRERSALTWLRRMAGHTAHSFDACVVQDMLIDSGIADRKCERVLTGKGFIRWRGFTVGDLFMWACIGFAIGLTLAGYL